MTLLAMMSLRSDDVDAFGSQTAKFSGLAELVAELQRFAAAEGVEVCASPDKGTILLRRAGAG